MEKPLISRRQAVAGGLSTLGGFLLPGCSKALPPTYGNILRMGDVLTYLAHRNLLSGKSLAREYQTSDISSFPAIGTVDPSIPSIHPEHSSDPEERRIREEKMRLCKEFEGLKQDAFSNWQLEIKGLVARKGFYSMTDLKRFPFRRQITKHVCEEGWSAIAEWTGVTLARVLATVGTHPSARFVHFYSYDGYANSIDMVDALHPQTLLAYAMNGRDLPLAHGAPLRLRVETQLGYTSMKYIRAIKISDQFEDHGKQGLIQNGWSWYAGI
ncbi:MAG: molybdopterin-dependent oxidoreductase [Verrucomicrobiota bacterium]|nr:molybdopterin-dependent oxidoreductase [Verrucomicrobiota bacterium]